MKLSQIEIKKTNIKSEILAILNAITSVTGNRILQTDEKARIKNYILKSIKLGYESSILGNSLHLGFQESFLNDYNAYNLSNELKKVISLIDQTETKNFNELDDLVDRISKKIMQIEL